MPRQTWLYDTENALFTELARMNFCHHLVSAVRRKLSHLIFPPETTEQN